MSETSEYNKGVLNNAAKLIKEKTNLYMVKTFLPKYLRTLIADYASNWSQHKHPSLTGQTYTSCVAGMYDNGSLVGTFGVLDYGASKPTSLTTYPGDKGFIDYDSGEFIGSNRDPMVFNYKHRYDFIGKPNQDAYVASMNFLRSFNSNVRGYSVVVVVGTDYAAYLEKVRGLDILTNTFLNAKGLAIALADSL